MSDDPEQWKTGEPPPELFDLIKAHDFTLEELRTPHRGRSASICRRECYELLYRAPYEWRIAAIARYFKRDKSCVYYQLFPHIRKAKDAAARLAAKVRGEKDKAVAS